MLMRLQALDQIHVSSVKPDSLRPGEEFEIDDEPGAALLKQHPATFRAVAGGTDEPAEKSEPAPANKAEPAPKNKATKPAGNKAKAG